MTLWGFPHSSVGKESAYNAGNPGSIPGLGRFPGEGKGYPLQYSGLENSMDYTVHGVAKSQTWLSDFHFHTLCSQRWRCSIQSTKTRQGADCGSDHELIIAKFRLKLKKVGKTTRPLSSVQFSCSLVPDSLRPHESQHARPPCPSPTPRVHSNSCPSSWWCHLAISSSGVPFSSCPQSLPASESFPMSQFFAWGGQSIGVLALALFLPKNTQDGSPLEWTGWISLQSKGLSRVFSNTTVQKHQFFGAQLSSQPNSHIHTWLLEKL